MINTQIKKSRGDIFPNTGGYTKTKRSQARGFLKHVLYVFGLVKMNNYPDYFQQEFHE